MARDNETKLLGVALVPTRAAGAQNQHRAVALQGNDAKAKHYNTVQVCAGGCQCKYFYAGTSRHDVYGLNQVAALKSFHEWLDGVALVPSTHKFNEALNDLYNDEKPATMPRDLS